MERARRFNSRLEVLKDLKREKESSVKADASLREREMLQMRVMLYLC